MGVPDPTCLLTRLEYELHETLLTRLNENSAWKLVAEASGIFSGADILKIEKKTPSPSQALFAELNARLCNVGSLCFLLEKCQLPHILALLKEHEPVVITKQPEGIGPASGDEPTLYIRLSGEAQLECQARGLPPPEYMWYHGNVEIPGQTGGKLCLQDFSVKDEGEYYCCVSQPSVEKKSEVYSTRVHVRVLPEAPSLLVQPRRNVECLQGDDVTIACMARGYPSCKYQWYHEDAMLPDECSNTLHIPNAELRHEGKYICLVRNNAGKVWSDEANIQVFKCLVNRSDKEMTRHVATEKVALLIANETYNESGSLKTPSSDVIILARRLTQLGFRVISCQNLTRPEMRTAVGMLCDSLPVGAYALFYYAGHGFEMHDKYMLPVDAPPSDKFLQRHSLCEKEIIREVLKTKPQLFVILLDMCLVVPNIEDNPGIHEEVPEVFTYEPGRNLVQGYATTSNKSAYENRKDINSIYMKHLEKLLLPDNNTPINRLMDDVALSISKDVPYVSENQMPSHFSNVVNSYRLNDKVTGDAATEANFKKLNCLPFDTMKIEFEQVKNVAANCSLLGCFQNAMQIRISNLDSFDVVFNANIEALKVELLDHKETIDIPTIGIGTNIGTKTEIVVIIKHLQKTNAPLKLTIALYDKGTTKLVDSSVIDLGWPLIANVWPNKNKTQTGK